MPSDHDHAACGCGHEHGPKHIYIYSPSSAVRDKAAFRRGIRRLQALGHEVEIDPDALAQHTRFAGDDATRLAAIHRAAASGAEGGKAMGLVIKAVRERAGASADGGRIAALVKSKL